MVVDERLPTTGQSPRELKRRYNVALKPRVTSASGQTVVFKDGSEVEVKGDSLHATVPGHRLDIQEGPADLIEEIARVCGYDRLPATLLRDQLPLQSNNEPLLFEERLRDLLVGAGLQEAITYALTTPEREAPLRLPPAEYVRLLNPISAERALV